MSESFLLKKPVLMDKSHIKDKFDCGYESLNIFLQKYAIQNDRNNSSRTYVSICQTQNLIAGYYSLTYGSISHEEATSKVKRTMPNYPIPVMILARLAVSNEYKKLGIGRSLLKDALLRTLQASSIGGLRDVIAHAKDDSAKQFYLKYGFEESVLDEYHLILRVKDIELSF